MDNIFSALIHRRSAGAVWEFVLWCILCFEALFAMVTAILAGSKATWIMLMLFIAGLAVLMAFRLTAIALLYSVGAFHLLTFTVDFICYRSGSVMELILFVSLLLLALAALICSFIHNFSKFDLDKVVMILVTVDSVLMMILQIVIYVKGQSLSFHSVLNWIQGRRLDHSGYWAGTICFWILLVVIDLYYILFVLGVIQNGWKKIIKKPKKQDQQGNPGRVDGVPAGVQGISGQWTGQVVYMGERGLIIGSDRAAGADLVIQDAFVSRWHCALRFVPGGNGFYEVFDRSTNGVYLGDGSRLPKNVWNRLQRGSVLCIGGMEQRLQLL